MIEQLLIYSADGDEDMMYRQILQDIVISKQKAKMALMDFGKIAKGEATSDALRAYTVA